LRCAVFNLSHELIHHGDFFKDMLYFFWHSASPSTASCTQAASACGSACDVSTDKTFGREARWIPRANIYNIYIYTLCMCAVYIYILYIYIM
jgi:hypothetical protein